MKEYQKAINVKGHKITSEWKPLWKMAQLLPKDLKILSIACAEGFDIYMMKKQGILNITGVEIHKDKVVSGRKYLGLGEQIMHGDIFTRFDLIKKANCFIVCRFFHNLGEALSEKIMNEINKHKDYVIIVKHKEGKFKENGKPRQPLAMKKGVGEFLSRYNLNTKSFRGDFVVGAKGKYKEIPDMLREHLPEPV